MITQKYTKRKLLLFFFMNPNIISDIKPAYIFFFMMKRKSFFSEKPKKWPRYMLWAKFKNLQRREKKALHRFLHNFTARKDINISLIKKPVVFIFYKYLLPHSFAHFNSNKFEFIRIKKSKTFIFLYLS